MVGQEGLVAEFVTQTSRSDDFLDEWRRDRDRHVTVSGSRYSTERGYLANVVAAGKRVMELAGINPANVGRVALSSPDGRAHLDAAKKLGFAQEQLVEVPVTGVTGTAQPLELLCAALDDAEPGEFVVNVGYGDGADALLFRKITERRTRLKASSGGAPVAIASYARYRKLRDFTRSGPEDGAVISNVMFEKEERQNLRLHGTRCTECETVQFPPTAICVKCHSREGIEEVTMARRGTIFTFTRDNLYVSPNPPTATAVIDMEDGARFYCQVTDADVAMISIGQYVELTLRRFKEGGGMHHYYWKCRPV
jgi:uncharacterized OB-fold protein